jgi:serine/threonine-protein kinase RsbW
VEVAFRLALPRDELSIPVVRRILDRSMEVLGVEPEDRSDITLAITECCTNVLDHAQAGDDYAVTCGIRDDGCHIRVIDHGCGFDPDRLPMASATAEQGRGVLLMRALVDSVQFEQLEEDGAVVSLHKRLRFLTGSPAERLSDQ